MTSTRDNILQRIRQANQQRRSMLESDAVNQRLRQHARGPRPQWQEDSLTRFLQKAEQSAASYERVQSNAEIVRAVAAYMEKQALDTKLVIAGTPLLKRLEWSGDFLVESRAATTEDKIIVAEAFAAIAETGSIVLCSGKETPVSLNFLPDYYICIIHTHDIINTMEDIWEKIRARGTGMPRAVNIITGPSRTADVEQIIQLGAHGPRQVHLLLLG